MKILDIFNPDVSDFDRKLSFIGWVHLSSAYERLGMKLEVRFDLAAVREFWESIPVERRNQIRMPPVHDVNYHKETGPQDVAIFIAKTESGAPGAMMGLRRVWLGKSLAEEMESLKFWYGEQAEEMRKAGKICKVTAIAPHRLESLHVAWMGAGMNLTGNVEIYRLLSRTAVYYAATHWKFNSLTAIVERATFRLHGFDWYGLRQNELGVFRDGREFLFAQTQRRDLIEQVKEPGFCEIQRPLLAANDTRIQKPASLDDYSGFAGYADGTY